MKTDNQLASGGSTTSVVRIRKGNKRVRNIKSISRPQHYLENGATRLNSNQGGQVAVTIFGGMFTNGDLAAFSNAVYGFNTAGSTVSSKADEFVLKSCIGDYLFTNSGNGNVVMYLYDCLATKDVVNSDSLTVFPEYAWQQGVADEYNGGALANNTQVWPTKPFLSKLFKENFHVVKVNRIVLSPGVAHRHYIKYHPNKVFSFENIAGTSQYTNIRGLTWYTMVVLHGLPMHGVTAGAVTGESLAAAVVDVIGSKSYEYRYTVENNETYQVSNVLVNNLTTPTVFEEGTGLPTALRFIDSSS